MTGSSHSRCTAEIVDLVSLLDSAYRKRSINVPNVNKTATLLSIRQNLTYRAAVGVEDITTIQHNFSYRFANEVQASLRKLLSVEFGHLRVYRHKQVYVVSHHCLETLIAGLLRVQFQGKRMELPVVNARGELVDNAGVAFYWGAGMSVAEAESERQRRYRLKRS